MRERAALNGGAGHLEAELVASVTELVGEKVDGEVEFMVAIEWLLVEDVVEETMQVARLAGSRGHEMEEELVERRSLDCSGADRRRAFEPLDAGGEVQRAVGAGTLRWSSEVDNVAGLVAVGMDLDRLWVVGDGGHEEGGGQWSQAAKEQRICGRVRADRSSWWLARRRV